MYKLNSFSLKKISKHQSKDTGLAIVLILLILVLYSKNYNILYYAISILIVDMTWPDFFKPAAMVWFGFAHISGNFMSKIILSIIFFIIITPVALVRKIIGKDTLQLKKWKTDSPSFFIDRNIKFNMDNVEKPY